uniref:Uncharacterized protein n=1 Tax=Arundo donax TaxID=35708 RepID=A0A0A9B057_ARUDO
MNECCGFELFVLCKRHYLVRRSGMSSTC